MVHSMGVCWSDIERRFEVLQPAGTLSTTCWRQPGRACFVAEARVDEGTGINVLNGPLHALRHFVLEQQRCSEATKLRAGDAVITGTWTDAWPLEPGQDWRAEFDAPFDGLEIALI